MILFLRASWVTSLLSQNFWSTTSDRRLLRSVLPVDSVRVFRQLQESLCQALSWRSSNLLPGVYFTNSLRAAFSFKRYAISFLVFYFRFVIFWRKEIGIKAALKMLMKLTTDLWLLGVALLTYSSSCLSWWSLWWIVHLWLCLEKKSMMESLR